MATLALVIAAAASACDGVGGSVSPGSAGPNDPIGYSISGLDAGASYRVTIAGQQVDSGVNGVEHGSAGGSFPMPDYGAQARTVYVTLYASHSDDNFEWNRSFPVDYVPPVAASGAGTTTSATAEPQRSAPSHRAKAPQPTPIAKHVASKQRHDSPSTGSAVGAAPADALGSEPGPGKPSSGSGEAKASGEANASGEESSSAPHRVFHALGSTTKVGPANVPIVGLLAMGLAFIFGAGLTAFVVYLLQSGPNPDAALKAPAPLGHDPVEVELQEMIAAEMARKLLSDLDLAEPSISVR